LNFTNSHPPNKCSAWRMLRPIETGPGGNSITEPDHPNSKLPPGLRFLFRFPAHHRKLPLQTCALMKRLLTLCLLAGTWTLHAAQVTLGPHTFTLPDGFTIELVANTPLVDRPIEADFDDQGRLYVTDSSGSNDKSDKQLAEK